MSVCLSGYRYGRVRSFDVDFAWLFGFGLRYRDVEDAVFQGSLTAFSLTLVGDWKVRLKEPNERSVSQ
jgi:hypothetical protein